MRQQNSPARTWRRALVAWASTSIALIGVAATPALGTSKVSGTGSASVVPTSVVAPKPSSLQFRFKAASAMAAGVVSVGVPDGWTSPSALNTTSSVGSVGVVGSTVTVSNVTLAVGQTMTITYGTPTTQVIPPSVAGYDTFVVAMSPNSSDPPAALNASPLVFVYEQAPQALFDEMAAVPLAVFNKVGVSSPHFSVTPPTVLRHQRPFVTKLHGATVPRSFFDGFEWCPYCAPSSWGVIVALNRFGHFDRLFEVVSTPQDYSPNTPGFTFHWSTYTSPFLTFNGFETEGPFSGQPLNPPPRAFRALMNQYDSFGGVPFVDVGNLAVEAGSPFLPTALGGASQDQIGAHLTVASNPVTRAIVAWANYFTAAICSSDHERPNTVCKSPGVVQADVKLGLARP
jgi:Domain of unknown function (DUF929)